jgi:hypothetical protein
MRLLRVIGAEALGVFVDDGAYAVSILAWLGIAWMLGRIPLPPPWPALILPAGLMVVLVIHARRRAGADRQA